MTNVNRVKSDESREEPDIRFCECLSSQISVKIMVIIFCEIELKFDLTLPGLIKNRVNLIQCLKELCDSFLVGLLRGGKSAPVHAIVDAAVKMHNI